MSRDNLLTVKLDESSIENLYLLFCNLNVQSIDFNIESMIKAYLICFHLGFPIGVVVSHFDESPEPDFSDLKCIYQKGLREKSKLVSAMLAAHFPESSNEEREALTNNLLSIL
jgi:hypothetical protein